MAADALHGNDVAYATDEDEPDASSGLAAGACLLIAEAPSRSTRRAAEHGGRSALEQLFGSFGDGGEIACFAEQGDAEIKTAEPSRELSIRASTETKDVTQAEPAPPFMPAAMPLPVAYYPIIPDFMDGGPTSVAYDLRTGACLPEATAFSPLPKFVGNSNWRDGVRRYVWAVAKRGRAFVRPISPRGLGLRSMPD